MKKFTKVNVEYYSETGTLFIDDWQTDEQLAVFRVYED